MKVACKGRVYLVGAGCGKAELITVRGLELLRRCGVAVYDDLIDRALLREIPSGAEAVYMGKRQGKHSASQEEICARLIQYAREGKMVVRLKGGDPFLFGRGGEEMAALRAAGVPCEEVPGVTSALAIPAMAGIPVTHRGMSRSVHIATAHTMDGLPEFLDRLAPLPGTLVFLMGLSQLEEISRRLMAAGKPGDTPAAVLSGGNAPHPAVVRGTLADIAGRVREAGVRPPAVIVVGAVAELALTATIPAPLAGITVGLSGSEAMAEKLRRALEPLGASTFVAQRSVLRPLPLLIELASLCDGLPRWLVFTSANGVREFFRRLKAEGVDLRRLAACRFAVIGGATGGALAAHGFQADLRPGTYTTAALAQALLAAVPPQEEICLLRSRQGSEELLQTLAADRRVRDIHLYDAEPAPSAEEDAARLEEADYLVFTSAGGVRMFLERHGGIPAHAKCVCIGGVTAAALVRHWDGAPILARDTCVEGIAAAIVEDAGQPGQPACGNGAPAAETSRFP